MSSQSPLQKLESRIAKLETQSRRWQRAAMILAAACVLGFVGWAPQLEIDKPDVDSLNNEADAPAQQADLSEGDRPYAVSRLEWISVRSNAMVKRDTWLKHGFIIQFVSGGAKSNTIRIIATYDAKRVNRQRMNAEADAAAGALQHWSKQRGWDSWLNVGKEFVAR